MKLDTILGLPLFLSELSVIIGLGLLVAFGEGDVKMVVGVFAIAAFRLLPALRTLLTGWTQIQNTAYCLNTIEEGLSRPVEAVSTYSEEMPFEKEITVKELAYAYPGSGAVLEKFNCRICKGEHVGFKGSSGVGKSTLFNLLAGLLEPNSGEIWIDGILLNGTTRSSWMKRLGYVPQEVFIFNGTLAENIALGRKKIDYDRVKEILEQVSLSRWAEALPDGIHTLLGEAGGRLSGGQRQRIGIARALYKRVEVLLLDEATSALDNVTEKEINETLCQLKEKYKGLTILSIAHRESSLTYCETYYYYKKMNMNKIYQVAGHRFMVSGKELCTVTEGIAGFKPFEVQQKDALFVFLKSADVPIMDSVQYTFKYEDVTGTFGRRDRLFSY